MMMMKMLLVLILSILLLMIKSGNGEIDIYKIQSRQHPITLEFYNELESYNKNSSLYNESSLLNIAVLGYRLANIYSSILLADEAQVIFQNAFFYVSPNSTLGLRFIHIMSVLSFSQGDIVETEKLWKLLDKSNDLTALRSISAQIIMGGRESIGISALLQYTSKLGVQFCNILKDKVGIGLDIIANNISTIYGKNPATIVPLSVSRSPSTEESEEDLLNLLLSESQGGVRLYPRIQDLQLSASEIHPLDARQRFRLGVGLAKLGLFDLSLRHVKLSATPWEVPLYSLRAKLIFSPVHSSVRALAQAVDYFVKQGESILIYKTPMSPLMAPICNSLNEAALALQALPLLHLAGFAAPRDSLILGHAPVALPILLSEIYMSMCPIQPIPDYLQLEVMQSEVGSAAIEKRKKKRNKKLRIGIIAGSFDGMIGRIVVGIVDNISKENRKKYRFIVMCFPTPRDALTDRIMTIFDKNINLSTSNKTEAIARIRDEKPDMLIFADCGLDSRAFAMSHERLARVQTALWGWGGTLGIPTIDYYIVPDILWRESHCPRMEGGLETPQDLFMEQVLFLDGLPALPRHSPVSQDILYGYLQDRLLLPNLNMTHVYLFPGSVKHLHPEFDSALVYLLKTDPLAMVIVTVPRTARDALPTTHIATRHDLMHPTMPHAAVAKFRNRMRAQIGENVNRIRILPPIDEPMFNALQLASIAVLDPFPVGMNIQIFEALMDGVPVVSAPSLQECTNSHVVSLMKSLGIPFVNNEEWPTTAEEYAVLAIRLHSDENLRSQYVPIQKLPHSFHGDELLSFLDISNKD